MIKHEEIKNHIDLSMMNRRITDGLYFALEQYIAEQKKKDELLEQLQGNTLRNRNLILETSNKLLKEDLETKNKLLDLYRELHETQDMVTYDNVLAEIKALEEELK